MRGVRKAIQEPQWPQVPPAAFRALQSGAQTKQPQPRQPAESSRSEHECECCWRRACRHGRLKHEFLVAIRASIHSLTAGQFDPLPFQHVSFHLYNFFGLLEDRSFQREPAGRKIPPSMQINSSFPSPMSPKARPFGDLLTHYYFCLPPTL